MKRLIGTKNIPKEEWLSIRKQGLTGTDAGAITGMNPYVSAFDVWTDKLSADVNEIDNEAMRQGRDLEAYVAQRFTEETGLKVRNVNFICQNDEHPILIADFDRLVVGQDAGLECKTVSPYSSDRWSEGQIPPWYVMQVQHYLAVSGYDCWYIAALIFGKDFIIRRIDRDEELIKNLIKIEERFWDENIIRKVMPDPDGTKRCSEQIAEMFLHSNKDKTVVLNGYKQILDRRSEIDGLIKKLETEKDMIDQKIKIEMEDAAYAMADGYKVSWVSAESRRLDTQRLKEEKPDIYNDYCTTGSYRRFMVKPAA